MRKEIAKKKERETERKMARKMRVGRGKPRS